MKSLQMFWSTLMLSICLVHLPLAAQEAQEEEKQETEGAEEIRICRLLSEEDLWSGPSRNFKIVRKAEEGLLLEIIGEKNEYYRVRVPDGFRCYIYAKYLEVDPNSLGKVTGENVFLRSIPRVEGDYPIFQVDRGEKLMVWDRIGDWYEVTAPEAAYLYVQNDKVELVEETEEIQKELQALKANRFVQWTAHQKEIRRQLDLKIKIDESKSELTRLDEASAGGFAAMTIEEVHEGYKSLAENAPDEATRNLAKARAAEVEAIISRRQYEEELKAREAAWRKERTELQQALEDAKRVNPEPATHNAPGKGRAVVVIGMVDAGGPEKWLRGGKSLADVLYRIECPDGRYVLPDFHGKRIRINGRIADPPPMEEPNLLVIERIEILN
jgi:uncharacterized protein YgiM (DUF1202 family)